VTKYDGQIIAAFSVKMAEQGTLLKFGVDSTRQMALNQLQVA
jgi:hypothetical protein